MIVSLFIIWKLGLTATTYLGSLIFPRLLNGAIGAQSINKTFDYWSSWAQWDGGHYYFLAKNGYANPSDTAFMPLYPALIKMVNFIFNNLLVSGLVVANLSFILFLLFFYKIIKTKYNRQIAKDTLLTFLFFPTTFFCIALYSESLFLLLAVVCFWAITKKKFMAASALAGFAAITRLIGLFLLISIIYSYLANRRFKINKKIKDIVVLIGIFSIPLIVYIGFLIIHFKNPLLPITSQGFWGRQIQDPISTIFSYFWSAITLYPRPINDYFDLALTIIFLGILIYGPKKISSSLWIFSTLAILIPASTSTLTSIPRYALASLGAFVIFAKIIGDRRNLKILFWTISLILQIILATLFINGYWIA